MISVVLTTHNEEKNLEATLESVKIFADQVIIVDGESTDGTVELAKKLGAEVISTTNKQNFHINKQMAMDKARGDLILQLDADEVVDEVLAKYIIKIHEQVLARENISAAWWVKRKNLFFGRFLSKGGQYPDPVIRLYQKGKARLPQKSVHEQMIVDGEIGWAEGHFLHLSNPTFSVYLRKFNTYTSFSAEQLTQAGQKPGTTLALRYFCWKPLATFFSLYFRHKGFVDGTAGFLFAVCSGLHFPVAYLKLCEIYEKNHSSS